MADRGSSDNSAGNDAFDLACLAAASNLEVDRRDTRLWVSRHGYSVGLTDRVVEWLTPSTVVGRHLAYAVFFGVRLAIDYAAADFDVVHERRAAPQQVFHPRERPSVYGRRLPRLVAAPTVEWFRALTGHRPIESDWMVDPLSFVYILETGKHLHVLTKGDMAELDMAPNKVLGDARRALFYESFKLKPRRQERTDDGCVRTFQTADGLTAGRAILMPDFGYDAAREGGCFSIPSRDTLVIGQPAESSRADAIRDQVGDTTAGLVQSQRSPLCSRVYPMTVDQISVGDYVGQHRLPARPEVTDEVAPPADVKLHSAE